MYLFPFFDKEKGPDKEKGLMHQRYFAGYRKPPDKSVLTFYTSLKPLEAIILKLDTKLLYYEANPMNDCNCVIVAGAGKFAKILHFHKMAFGHFKFQIVSSIVSAKHHL